MDSQSQKSRKRLLLLATAIALLLLLSVFILREKPPLRSTVYRSESAPTITTGSDDCSCPSLTNTDTTHPSPPSSPELTQKTGATESGLIDSANASLPTGAVVTPQTSAPFAIVDIKRILAARQSTITATEAQSNLLAKIKGLVSTRARSHHLEFVFDVSAQSSVNTPMFINLTNGALDITDEVLKDLSQ